jgi:mono/diheme cytochrome c family protein
MKNFKIVVMFLLVFSTMWVSCTKEKEVAAVVSYSKDVQPILQANCIGCHNPTGPAAATGAFLDNYTNLKAVGALQRNGQNLIVGAIKHLPGISPMPKNGTKLSDADIKKVESWITAGAPNN